MEYFIGESHNRNGRRHPDHDEWYGYRWPATRLTDHHRQMLCVMSNELRKPMTQLLADAVELLYEKHRSEG